MRRQGGSPGRPGQAPGPPVDRRTADQARAAQPAGPPAGPGVITAPAVSADKHLAAGAAMLIRAPCMFRAGSGASLPVALAIDLLIAGAGRVRRKSA